MWDIQMFSRCHGGAVDMAVLGRCGDHWQLPHLIMVCWSFCGKIETFCLCEGYSYSSRRNWLFPDSRLCYDKSNFSRELSWNYRLGFVMFNSWPSTSSPVSVGIHMWLHPVGWVKNPATAGSWRVQSSYPPGDSPLTRGRSQRNIPFGSPMDTHLKHRFVEANFVAASLRDKDCCLATCAKHACGAGWFNSSLAAHFFRRLASSIAMRVLGSCIEKAA